MKCITRCSIEA